MSHHAKDGHRVATSQSDRPAAGLAGFIRAGLLTAMIALSITWVLDIPIMFNLGLLQEQFLLMIVALSAGAAFLGGRAAPGPLDKLLAVAAVASWSYGAWQFPHWIVDASRAPDKWIPAVIALLTLLLAVRRLCGTAIAIVALACIAYGLFGHFAPGLLQANYTEPRRLMIYLYTDANAVAGVALQVAASVVVAFLVFSRVLQTSGAGNFFDDVAMSLLGHYRGGPAKVAVASSAMFGIINGSTVANVVSSGVVTIPLMIRNGMRPAFAAAVEAVSSNAGQMTPPVMGATAFLIADFLQVPYSDVVMAAAIPAFIFYVVMYVQLDAYAARNKLVGLPRSMLPRFGAAIAAGWIFIIPIALLTGLMFFFAVAIEKAALLSAVVMVLVGAIKQRRLDWRGLLKGVTVGAGDDALAVLLVSAAAGIVVGTLNISGLGFLITLVLAAVGKAGGLVLLLLVTAFVALVLGMGMPTAAVYVLLAVLLGPTMVQLGVEPMAAHFFIFYFGLLSMLTPPVAIASFAAASLARAGLGETSIEGLKLSASTYLLPFIFVMNPALLGIGSWSEVLVAIATTLAGGALIGWSAVGAVGSRALPGWRAAVVVLVGAVTSFSSIWAHDTPVGAWIAALGALGFAYAISVPSRQAESARVPRGTASARMRSERAP
ncbi:TRAP transporter 4TM/12TM fusion protein [Aquabacter spiritensis]|uniref:TRAP transporter 4TM/12TM fusion protein n=2 Tax=Aquabacter spiritensis TaxID=933073 RepID=A0A4R3LR09_9HYPH|nr:TRAP transporter 4TM/12TM fusion protein [Aquabacter spiritensis]